jgi:hypothetical protein
MWTDELVRQAIEHGNSIGQVALAEFILKEYEDELSPKLKMFLSKVNQSSYEAIGKCLDEPAEDVALQVSEIIALKF